MLGTIHQFRRSKLKVLINCTEKREMVVHASNDVPATNHAHVRSLAAGGSGNNNDPGGGPPR